MYRKSAVSGMFYPASKNELKKTIENYLKTANGIKNKNIKAIIVPHAGYVYSGQIAAYGYSMIDDIYRKVILLGNSHYVNFNGLSVFNGNGYETPLGSVDIFDLPFEFQNISQAHSKEHTLEVQIPFLQSVLTNFKISPIIMGKTDVKRTANDLINVIDNETLIVVSTDMSHFLTYEKAVETDSNTAKKITNLLPEELKYDELCGMNAVKTILYIAKEKNWEIEQLIVANSGDVSDDKSRVVGYGTWILKEKE